MAAFSPVSLRAVLAGARGLGGSAGVAHDRLVELLRIEYAADEVILCGSGTQALQLAIELHSRGASAELPVALPAFGCFDLVSAAIGAKAPIVLYDLDHRTLGPDLASLDRILAAGVRACVVAPLYGIPVPWDAIDALAVRYGVPLVEDAAQGQGASWDHRMIGSIGSSSVISFGRGKGWTGGGGGALLLRAPNATGLGMALPDIPFSGEVKSVLGLVGQWALGRPQLYGVARAVPALGLGTTVFHPPHRPEAMSRTASVVARATRGASQREAGFRRANAVRLLDRLGALPGVVTFPILRDAEAGFLRLPIRLPALRTGKPLEIAVRRMGIERSYPFNLAKLPAALPWLREEDKKREWIGADTLAGELVTCPTHGLLREDDLDEIVRTVARLSTSN